MNAKFPELIHTGNHKGVTKGRIPALAWTRITCCYPYSFLSQQP